MVATLSLVLASFASFSMASAASATPASHDTTAVDTAVSRRIVKQFPPVEVRAALHDVRSSETVRAIRGPVLQGLPVDGAAEALALQPGVVAQGEELHVRGGRAGETTVYMDGLCLSEPQWHRAASLPLLALANADLVSGSPEAQYGSGLAGVVDLHSEDPGRNFSIPWRWQSALGDRWYDRWAARIGTPLHALGLGLLAAGDATFDDSWLPSLRAESRSGIAGLPFLWRADNRVTGFFKLAPVDRPQVFSAEVLVSRHLQRPYDRAWTLDGWVTPPRESTFWVKGEPHTTINPPHVDAGYQPGDVRYSAADHVAVTDQRQVASLVSVSRLRPTGRASLSLGWLRTRTVASPDGTRGSIPESQPYYAANGFDVIYGDYPIHRESGSDVFTLRGDEERRYETGWIKAGAGATYEDVSLRELQYLWSKTGLVHRPRTYHAYAPGGFAYVQGRWQVGGMVMNTGLRGEYWTAGPQADGQTLPWDGHGVISLSPRLGIAYPVSVRDAFSLAYQRSHQAPGRDYLYDNRGDYLSAPGLQLDNREPLGNPNLRPATMSSYEVALKHLFNLEWAVQVSAFYREVYGEVGARNPDYRRALGLPLQSVYVSEDYATTTGFELSVIRAAGESRRIEFHYTFMHAWGLESQPEGDPYSTLHDLRAIPTVETPLSWDRRHSFLMTGVWAYNPRLTVSWSTAVGSPLPWTPKPCREQLTDLGLVNSRELDWSENTNADVKWAPAVAHGLEFGFAVRNLFDSRGEIAATVDGYPNHLINTVFDDYAAYRAETGQGGGAYWVQPVEGSPGHWVPVHDPRLYNSPRSVRLSLGARW